MEGSVDMNRQDIQAHEKAPPARICLAIFFTSLPASIYHREREEQAETAARRSCGDNLPQLTMAG